jgi:hypothetical protein
MKQCSNSDEQAPEPETPVELPLSRYRGIAKEVFQDLGGGDAFIRGERERFMALGTTGPSGTSRRRP